MRAATRFGLAIALALAAALGLATPAYAHASLDTSDPAAGAVLDASPAAIMLRFTEAVGITDDALRLFDADGDAVVIGRPGRLAGSSSSLTAAVPTLADGLYVVAWRAVSADSHPVSGAFTFTVGPSTGKDPSAVVAEISNRARSDRAVSIGSGVARAVFLVLFALLVGALVFPLLTGNRSVADWRWVATVLTPLTALSALSALLLAVPAAAGEGLSAIGSPAAWRAFLQTVAGWASAVRLGALVAATLVVVATSGARRIRRPIPVALGPIVAVAVVASGWAGHGASGRWVALGVGLTMVHTVAMSAWLGGLAVLGVLIVRDGSEASAAPMRRFSSAALGAVAVLAGTGVLQGWRQLGASNNLSEAATYFSNPFGRLLLIKAAIVSVMIAVAALSRRAVRRREGVGLLRPVFAELGLGVAVLVVTSALIVANPAGSSQGTGAVTVGAQDDAVAVSVFIEPARAGANTIHVTLRSPDFGEEVYDTVELTASLPSRDLGPLGIPLEANGRNHFTATAAQLPVAGRWTLTVAVQVSEFDRRVFSLRVRVRP